MRILLGAVLFILLGVVVFASWLSNHYKQIIRDRLPGIVARASDSLYKISISDIDIDFLTRDVTARNVRLWVDTAREQELRAQGRLPAVLLNISIPQLKLAGVKWAEIVSDKSLYCRYLEVVGPKVWIDAIPASEDTSKQLAGVPDTGEAKKPMVNHLAFGTIELLRPQITYHFQGADSFYCDFDGGIVRLIDWAYSSSEPKDPTRFLFAKSGLLAVDNFSYRKPGSLYSVQSANVHFRSDEDTISIHDFIVAPIVKKDEFYKRSGGIQREMYHVRFAKIDFVGLNWKSLIDDKNLFTKAVVLDTPRIDIFFSRYYKPSNKSKMGRFPTQLLQRLKLKLNLPEVYVANGHLKYAEVNEKTGKTGIVTFDDVRGVLSNVTNVDSLVSRNKYSIVKLRGNLLNGSDVSAEFNFLLPDTNGYFTLDGNVRDLNANQISDQSKALALAAIRSFHMSNMDMHIEGDQTFARGRFTMLYDSLSIMLEKVDSNMRMKKKGLLSLVANTLVLYPSNPMPGADPRTVETYIERDKLKSFFNLIWKNIYQAAQKSTLRNQQILDLVKSQPDKNGKKKGIFKKLFGRK
jgi:hypothetical protein